MSAGGKDDRLGMEDMYFTSGQLDCHNARGFSGFGHDEIKHLIFIEERDMVLDALLIQRLQDHMTGTVSRMCGASDGFASDIIRVAAKRTLRNLTFGRSIKRKPHMFKLEDGINRFITHELDCILIDRK